MKIQRMPEDVVPLLNDLVRRITSLESKPLGTVYVNEVIVARDPETGVETVMGDLTEYGEDRVGIKQWVNDTEPPPVMTSPMAIANLGTISVTWDGATSTGEPNSADFSHLNVYSHDGVSTKHIGVIRGANDFAMFLDPVYNQEYTFSFTSVDFNGNESEPSEPSLPVSAKPLVDALEIQNILDEINTRFDGVIDEALQLNTKLEEAKQTIEDTKTSLENLENVKLPQVEADIESAHQEIVSTGNELRGKLSQAETELQDHKTRLEKSESDLNNLSSVTLPGLKTDLDKAKTDLTKLDTDLGSAKTTLNATKQDVDTLKNTTLPGLKTDISSAQTRLDTAEASITNSEERIGKAESDLTNAFGQLGTVDSRIDTAKSQAATDAKSKADAAQAAAISAAATTAQLKADGAKADAIAAAELKAKQLADAAQKAALDAAKLDAQAKADAAKQAAITTAASDAQAKADAAQAEAKRLIDQVIAKGQNLVRNGDFESGGEGWNIGSAHYSIVSAPVRSGSKSLQVKDFGSSNAWPTSEWVPSSTGRTFYVEFWVREGGTPDDNGQIGAVAQVKTSSGGTSSLIFAKVDSASVPNFTWTRISGYATPTTEDVVAIRFAPWFEGPTASSYNVDDFLAVDVTEAQAALQRADQAISDAAAAHSAAGSAQTTANNALTMAGSKSKVYYSTANPSGTASVGDTWRKVDASNNVIAEWRWSDKNVWTPQQITSEVISNLDVGKLTAGSAIIQTAVINKIAAQSASIIELDASRITTGKLGAARIDVTDLAAAVATVIKLNASSIIAGTIDTGRLNASEIAAAVANIIQLNADRITAGIINTDRLNTNEIAARVATVIQLNADRITAGTINTDRLNAVEIAAKTAAFQKVDIKNLFVTTGTFSEAVIDKLWADVIRARKIAADQILIGQGENLIPYSVSGNMRDFSNFSSYSRPEGQIPPTLQSTGGVVDGNHLFMVADWVTPGTNTLTWQIRAKTPNSSEPGRESFWTVEPGEELLFSSYFKAGGTYDGTMPQLSLSVYFYTAGGVSISNVSSQFSNLTWSWVKHEISAKAPETAAYMCVYVRQNRPGGVRLDLPSLYRKKGASLIVDGAIEAKHITASESLSAKIGQFLKLDVKDLVSTGTAKLNEAVINKLWADVVHSKKITTEMLAIGDFTNQIATGLGMNNEAIDWAEGLTPDFVDVPVGISHSFKSAVGQGTLDTKSNFFDVNPGDEFVFEVWIKADKPGSRFFFELRDQNGAHGVTSTRLTTGDSFYGNASYPISSAPVPTTWTRWRAKCIPKEGVRSLRIASLYFNHPNGTERNAQIWLAGVSFRKRFGGELIVDGAVTAEKIAANAVEADKLAANSVTADKIEAGAVKAQHVGAKEISAEKLRIGEGTNVFPDSLMQDTVGWDSATWLKVYTGGYGSSNRVRVTASSSQTGGYYGNSTMLDRRFPVTPGRSYRVSVLIRPTVNISINGAISVYVRLYTQTGSDYAWASPSNINNSVETTGLTTIPSGQWTKMEGVVTVPAGTENTFMTPGLYLQSSFPTGSSCDFSNLVISEMTSGELIVDGAIDGKTITGALFQTHKEPEKGIKISNAGIDAYDTEGSKTMQITPGSGVDYMGFFGRPIHADQYLDEDGWIRTNVTGQNYVFFKPRADGEPFTLNSTVRFVFDAVYFPDPDNPTKTSETVTANIWTYPESSWGVTDGNKRVFSNPITVDTTPRRFDVSIKVTSISSPFNSWIAGLQSSTGTWEDLIIQDRVGIKNIVAYFDGEEIDLNPRQQLAGIDQSGEVSGQNLNMAGMSRLEGPVVMNGDPIEGHGSGNHGPVIMGRDLLGATYVDFFESHPSSGGAGWLTPMPHGLLSNSYENGWNGSNDNKWTMSGKPGGIQNMVHIQDTVEIKNGRGYLITYTAPAFKATDGNAGSPGASVVTYTTGRTIGIGTGKALHGSRYYFSGGPDLDNPGRTVYAVGGQDLPVGDVTLGVEVYVYDNRTIESTSTADARYWSLNVLDVGAAIKGNTGNSSRITRTRPVDTTKPPVDTPPPPPKPPAKKTYTKTLNATWWGTWWVGNGNGRNSGLDKDGKAAQGKPPGVGYRQRGAIGFKSSDITAALSGATVKKIEVYVYAAHWYSSAGGTLEIGTHGHNSKPGTWSGGTTGVKNQKLAKPEGRWITLPSSVHAGFKSGSLKGIQVYTSSTSSSSYGYLTGSKTKIRLTYEK